MGNNNKTIAAALSGGVDSGAAAYILKNEGFNVFGVTMKLFDGFDTSGAEYVAEKLKIKHYILDFSEYFEKEIINKFTEEYLSGKTPNPCIMCNMKIKYGLLPDEARKLGADYLATGHYTKIIYDGKDNMYHLYKSKAESKDQSYYLYHLNQEKLSFLRFPLAEYENKGIVRDTVRSILPETTQKKDSLDICFVQNMSHYQFIKKRCGTLNDKGNFIDINGKYLGRHKGIYNYTIGQKRGLGINFDRPMYVVNINTATKEITLGKDKDTYRSEIHINKVTYIDEKYKNMREFNCEIKLCQWGYFINCTVYNNLDDTAAVMFEKPERAPAPGQSAVFYSGDEVLGGGIIERCV